MDASVCTADGFYDLTDSFGEGDNINGEALRRGVATIP